MIDRKELLKRAGDIVLVQYSGAKKADCFIIGWLYLMDEDSIHLKITSTRFESYESVSVPIANISSAERHEMN